MREAKTEPEGVFHHSPWSLEGQRKKIYGAPLRGKRRARVKRIRKREKHSERKRKIESRSQKEALACCWTEAGKPKEEEVGYNLQRGEQRFMSS